MNLQEYIGNIIDKPSLWKYYDGDIAKPSLNDPESCRNFINDYTLYAKKSSDFVTYALEYLLQKYPYRLKHIVVTYFLGIALFNDKRLYFGNAIRDLLKQYKAFQGLDEREINKEFNFVWFMITLYHDLGYVFEKGNTSPQEILEYRVSDSHPRSIPHKYTYMYRDYERLEHPNDHGVCGGFRI